jgi:excinuclease ABC subunit A
LGPGAGRLGGEVVAVGRPEEIERNVKSITGQYLSGAKKIPVPAERRPINPERAITVRGANEHKSTTTARGGGLIG